MKFPKDSLKKRSTRHMKSRQQSVKDSMHVKMISLNKATLTTQPPKNKEGKTQTEKGTISHSSPQLS